MPGVEDLLKDTYVDNSQRKKFFVETYFFNLIDINLKYILICKKKLFLFSQISLEELNMLTAISLKIIEENIIKSFQKK